MEAQEIRNTLEKMGWNLTYFDACNWHPEVERFNNGDIDLYGVNDSRTDDYPLMNTADADYFCTVKILDDKNIQVDREDERYIPLLELAIPGYHFYVKY